VKKKKKNRVDDRDMTANVVPNPHDRFFKEMFSSKEIARSFLIHYLPPEFSLLMDSDSVELSKDTYVDSRLRSQFSDLLYCVTAAENHIPAGYCGAVTTHFSIGTGIAP
jgi:hypothetical protein